MVDILVSAIPEGRSLPPGASPFRQRDLFRAILAGERPRLTNIPDPFETLCTGNRSNAGHSRPVSLVALGESVSMQFPKNPVLGDPRGRHRRILAPQLDGGDAQPVERAAPRPPSLPLLLITWPSSPDCCRRWPCCRATRWRLRRQAGGGRAGAYRHSPRRASRARRIRCNPFHSPVQADDPPSLRRHRHA